MAAGMYRGGSGSGMHGGNDVNGGGSMHGSSRSGMHGGDDFHSDRSLGDCRTTLGGDAMRIVELMRSASFDHWLEVTSKTSNGDE